MSVCERAQRSACACVVAALPTFWRVVVWRERGFRGAANEQPASLELDERVTYLPELVRESDPPGRACASSHRRNRFILFLSLIRKPRARSRPSRKTHRACRPYSSAYPSTGSDVVDDALGVRVLSGRGLVRQRGHGSSACCYGRRLRCVGGWDGEYVTRDKNRTARCSATCARRRRGATVNNEQKNTQYRIHSHERLMPV